MASRKKTLWPLEPHPRGKHLVLKFYLDAWLPILGTRSGRILFIDGFAGPGEYSGDCLQGWTVVPPVSLDSLDFRVYSSKVTFAIIESVR